MLLAYSLREFTSFTRQSKNLKLSKHEEQHYKTIYLLILPYFAILFPLELIETLLFLIALNFAKITPKRYLVNFVLFRFYAIQNILNVYIYNVLIFANRRQYK